MSSTKGSRNPQQKERMNLLLKKQSDLLAQRHRLNGALDEVQRELEEMKQKQRVYEEHFYQTLLGENPIYDPFTRQWRSDTKANQTDILNELRRQSQKSGKYGVDSTWTRQSCSYRRRKSGMKAKASVMRSSETDNSDNRLLVCSVDRRPVDGNYTSYRVERKEPQSKYCLLKRVSAGSGFNPSHNTSESSQVLGEEFECE